MNFSHLASLEALHEEWGDVVGETLGKTLHMIVHARETGHGGTLPNTKRDGGKGFEFWQHAKKALSAEPVAIRDVEWQV